MNLYTDCTKSLTAGVCWNSTKTMIKTRMMSDKLVKDSEDGRTQNQDQDQD